MLVSAIISTLYDDSFDDILRSDEETLLLWDLVYIQICELAEKVGGTVPEYIHKRKEYLHRETEIPEGFDEFSS